VLIKVHSLAFTNGIPLFTLNFRLVESTLVVKNY